MECVWYNGFISGLEWSVSGARDLFQAWNGVECVWWNGFIPGLKWSVSGAMDLFQAWSAVCLVQWIYSRYGVEFVWWNICFPRLDKRTIYSHDIMTNILKL